MKSFIKTLMAGIFTSCVFWGTASAGINYDTSSLEAQRDVLVQEVQRLSSSEQDGNDPVANAHRNAVESLVERIQDLEEKLG